jgi:pyruvate dehydrogenase E1 component alpha subunit
MPSNDNLISYLNEEGELSPDYPLEIPSEILLKGYKTMLKTRLVDDKMITLQRQGMISFALSSLGEEACAVASAAALEPEDWLYPQYRELGVLFWRGFSIQSYLHHMFGNAEDLILGRQMPNHFGSREHNVVTVSSPIATKIPHTAGCAYAMKLQKEKNIAVCFFGEGATSEGDFHAGLNFAAVRKVPALFFCRNNGYAISTSCINQFACEGIASKAIAYGMPGWRVDGNDFFAIYDAVTKARKHCLEGKGPVLLEAMTYRLGAHSTADDPSVYRQEAEVIKWQEKDPILRLRRYLEKQGFWNEQMEKEYMESISLEIQEAIRNAKETPKPHLESIIEHVYFEVPTYLREELEEVRKVRSEVS